MIFARPDPNNPLNETLFRAWASKEFIQFITYTKQNYIPDPFHIQICSILQNMLNEPGPERIMIFAPPQHGKSEIISVRFPPFWLAYKPDKPVIITSYGAILAQSKAGQAREIINHPSYLYIFKDLAERMGMKNEPEKVVRKKLSRMITSAGVGGPITGFGAALGIIDDPVKNYEEALSATFRERVWQWYLTTFRTRVWENGKIVIIMTRWHEDDLCGRLLNDQKDKWAIYRFPALSETQEERDNVNIKLKMPPGLPDLLGRLPGKSLAPHRFGRRTLLETQEEIGPMPWSSEYQGFPQTPGGNMFKEEWFTFVETYPRKVLKRVRYWDKAATAGGGARTTGCLMSYDGKFWTIEDVTKGQWSTWQRESIIREVAEQDEEIYGPIEIWVEEEGGSGGKDSSHLTAQSLAGFEIHFDHVHKAKEIRAAPLASQAEAGHVQIVRGPWNKSFLGELMMFPKGTYKDQVDSASGAFLKTIRKGWARGAA